MAIVEVVGPARYRAESATFFNIVAAALPQQLPCPIGPVAVDPRIDEKDNSQVTMPDKFEKLLRFLERLPAIDLPAGRKSIGCGNSDNGTWWVKFRIDTKHKLAWRHVQEFGHVLNYLSVDERLPAAFMPVSPPPYLNGGEEFLSWVIESTKPDFTPDLCAQWLEERLPKPVDNPQEWVIDDGDEEVDEDP